MNTTKADLEKGLVEIETNKIIRKYPSEEIYHSLKRELKKRYNQVKSEIEDIRNSIREIGNHKQWFEWIDSFGVFISNQRDITDSLKKQLLKKVIDFITVAYDNKEKVHRLNVCFKIPVFHVANDVRTPVISVDQHSPVENYSTVTDLFPTAPDINNASQGYSLRFTLQITSSNLWVSPYSSYQQELFDIISKYHEDDNWNFKQISDWLVDNNYLTPRGHAFTAKHVWSIYQKKVRSIQRFSREFEDTITDMSIDVVDYIPVPKAIDQ